MLSLIRAEIARFRWAALAFAIFYFGVMLFFDRLLDLIQQPKASYQLAGAINVLIGLALGLFQAGSYARPSPWLMLLHRPLPPARIAIALIAGAALTLLAALAVPAVLLIAAHALAGGVIDLRHLMLPLAGWMFGLVGYGAGVIAVLAPRRYSALALIPALFPAFASATGPGALVAQAAIVILLGAVIVALFRHDRHAAPHRARAGLLVATVALGAYFAMTVVGDMIFQTVWIATGTHPLNSTPSKNGIVEASNAEGADMIETVLASSRERQAPLWREQAKLSEVVTVMPAFDRLPTRGELTNIAPMRFDDNENRVRWTFSHNDMRFHGVGLDDHRPAGILGIGDANVAFPAPPLASDKDMLISAESLDRFDPLDHRIYRRIHLPAGETLAAPPEPVGDSVVLLSDRAFRFYDARVLEHGDAVYPAFASVPLPAPVGSLMRIDVMELMDGHLLSFTYGRGAVGGPGEAWQSLVELMPDGHQREVARHAIGADFPTASRYADFWASPLIERVQGFALGLFAGRAPLLDTAPAPLPRSMALLAAILLGLAAAITHWLARRRGMARRQAAAWSLAALVIGLPFAIAFWLVAPARGRA